MDTVTPSYAPSDSLSGLLQRGRGDGFRRAISEQAPDEVLACIRVDWRWDWQVDARTEYLARLIRDLGIAIDPIVTQLRDSPDPNDCQDRTHRFQVATSILELLAVDGDTAAREALIDYIQHGRYWIDALESLVATWPFEDWDRLYPVAMRRLEASDVEHLFVFSDPWKTWETEHPEFAARCPDRRAAYDNHHARRRRRESTTQRLLALIRDPDQRQPVRTAALSRLSQRTVPPEILDFAEDLTFEPSWLDGTVWPLPGLNRAISSLGTAALGHARRWAADPENPLSQIGLRLVAGHGDHSDLPMLAAEVDQRLTGDDWCGYDTLFEGMIRTGVATDPSAPLAKRAVDQLRYLWESTPHSHERSSYLGALVALGAADAQLVEGLWDCEDDVRLLCTTTVPLDDTVQKRLNALRDDPLETTDVRTAAAQRLTGASLVDFGHLR